MSRWERVLRQATLANQLTLLRLVAVPFLGLALLTGHNGVALGLFVAAAITDRLDGIAARRLGQQTALGRFLDPAADKAMMLVVYVILAMPNAPRPFPDFRLAVHVPAWLTLLVVARDVLIVVVALGLWLAYGMHRFPPSTLGKWTTGVEVVTAGLYLLANVHPVVPGWLLDLAVWVMLLFLVGSGIDYMLRTRRHLATLATENGG
ncbi:MAG: CDP-diacylglycerol--glycerol-3-phosphate 3-phosphatidyltransferase [Acidobacteriota bacterium]|nr:MAG: CDP-alcohol phosphatidyltransferase family protein [Acidobacteriota bacterium]